MRKTKRKTLRRVGWLLVMLFLLGSLLCLRAGQAEAPSPSSERTEETSGEASVPASSPEARSEQAPSLPQTPSPADPPAAQPSAPEPTPRPVRWRDLSYSERGWFLVNDMVYAYRHDQSAAMGNILQSLEELKSADPDMGALWEDLMLYWDGISTRSRISYERLPDGLPDDDSLCLVVLGFQLLANGEMDPELEGRCEVALTCAAQYPNAWILVTGGGTAMREREVTEAGRMAAWLEEHGISRERIIVEDRSKTTAENALYSDAILYDRYPQVQSLAIITSDYHVGMGSLMFHTIAARRGYESGTQPYEVVANAAFPAQDREDTESPAKQATFLWSLMDPGT